MPQRWLGLLVGPALALTTDAAAQVRQVSGRVTNAQTGEGVPLLEERITSVLTKGHRGYRLDLPLGDGAGAAWLHQHGEVIDHWVEDGRAWYEVRMAPSDLERFQAQHERT